MMSDSSTQSCHSRWLNLMLEHQAGFFYERDASGNFIFVSPEVTNVLGWSPDQFIHQWSSWAKKPLHDPENTEDPFGENFSTGKLRSYRCKIPCKSGRMHWFEMVEHSAQTIEGQENVVEGFARNISSLYEEEKIRVSRENRFRMIMDFAPIGIFQTDTNMKLTYVNSYWQVITRVPLKETLGSLWYLPILEKERENVLSTWEREMEQSQEYFFQCQIARPSGEIRWVEFRSRTLFQDGGRVVFGTVEDITTHRLMATRLEKYTEELKRSNLDLESFATIASHDLKEPLRKMVAFGNRLNSAIAEQDQEQSQYFLERIQRAGERMQNLIEDLLQLSRITFEARPFVSLDFNKLLTEVISDLEWLIQKTNAVVRVSQLPWLNADEAQMRQLFINLLGNAIKFRREDTDVTIQINAKKQENGNWRFTIEDNGIGFDASNLDRILKPFERLHGKSQYEGSGIGLAICKKIIDRHHGTLTATSEPGKGSIFTFTLPGIS